MGNSESITRFTRVEQFKPLIIGNNNEEYSFIIHTLYPLLKYSDDGMVNENEKKFLDHWFLRLFHIIFVLNVLVKDDVKVHVQNFDMKLKKIAVETARLNELHSYHSIDFQWANNFMINELPKLLTLNLDFGQCLNEIHLWIGSDIGSLNYYMRYHENYMDRKKNSGQRPIGAFHNYCYSEFAKSCATIYKNYSAAQERERQRKRELAPALRREQIAQNLVSQFNSNIKSNTN